MTIDAQVKQTLASLKGAQSTIMTLAGLERNEAAKEIWNRNSQRLDPVIQAMQDRVGVLEFEEPQYKGF